LSKHATGPSSEFEWRQFGRYLWAGTGELGPVGTVEHGRRFTAIDVAGSVVGRCRNLADAQALLEHIAAARVHAERWDTNARGLVGTA
jgi:hypothetical protein